MDNARLVELTASITTTYVENNTIAAEQIPNFVTIIHAALADLADPRPKAEPEVKRARKKRAAKSEMIVSDTAPESAEPNDMGFIHHAPMFDD